MNQQFSTKQAKENLQANSKRTRLSPGIHTGVYLENVEITETVNGKPYMEFMFVKKETNEVAPKRVWFPSDKPYIKDGEDENQAKQREVNEALGHIVTILECFVPSDEAEITAGSFKEFCEVAAGKIKGSSFEDTPVRLKLLYDAAGVFTEFPRFPNYIERDVPGTEIKLKFSKWELANRMTPSEESEAPKDNSSSILNGKTEDKTDDLPF